MGLFTRLQKNHLVDFLTLSLELQREKRKRLLPLPKNLSQLSPFCFHFAYTQSRRIPAVTHKILFAEHAQTKCLYAPNTINRTCVDRQFDLNTLPVEGKILLSGEKKLRIQKYPDTCKRGLRAPSIQLEHFFRPSCRASRS